MLSISCSKDDSESKDAPFDCSSQLTKIETARSNFNAEQNSVNCSILKTEISRYLSNCEQNQLLSAELNSLGNCNNEEN